MATTKKTTAKKSTTSGRKGPAPKRRPAERPPRPVMPVWLKNTLAGLIIFTFTLRLGLLPQFIVCALALGVAVFQAWNHRARWLWTWTSLVAVGLFLVGVYLATRMAPAWFLYFGAWIFVIVAFVGEGSRAIRAMWRASTS